MQVSLFKDSEFYIPADYQTCVGEVKLKYKPNPKYLNGEIMSQSSIVVKRLRKIYDVDTISHYEQFVVLFLNRSGRYLGHCVLSKGGINGTVVDIRLIFQYALKVNANSIIVSHNHPSGSLTPSDADIKITKKIQSAGKLLEIDLLDHVILTGQDYFSFADERQL